MSGEKPAVSLSVIRRLPRYYRFLNELLEEDKTRISSKELSELMHLTASQIRQDLNCFGGFGQQGYGYNVRELHSHIAEILGLDIKKNCVLIGAGNLGAALVNHLAFDRRGFQLVGIFDIDPDVVGTKINGIPVYHNDQLEEFCKKHNPKVAVLCIPKEAAHKEFTDRLVDLGIQGFWNFSHYDLSLSHDDIVVENVHLGDSLMTLCYRVSEKLRDE